MAAREGGPVILVVEDKAYVRELLEAVLGSAGFSVESVPNGRAALETAARLRPDLVFLDFILPGLDGRQVLAALRENPDLRSVPVVVMSAWADAATLKDWEGAAAFLYKPFSVEELVETVQRLLAPVGCRDEAGCGEGGRDDGDGASAASGRPAPGMGAALPPGGEG